MFGNFNEVLESSFFSFKSLNVKEWNGSEEILILLYSLDVSNFHSQKLKGIEGIKLDLINFFIKTFKIPLYIFRLRLRIDYKTNLFYY